MGYPHFRDTGPNLFISIFKLIIGGFRGSPRSEVPLSVTGKRKKERQESTRLYDTSKCKVKFRQPRILQRRPRQFNENRDLNFNHRRVIDTRLQGVMFRLKPAVGFRNIGVGNIDDVMDKRDWPDVGPARPPESLKIQKDADWEETWGREESFQRRWGVDPKDVKNKTRDYLYWKDRIQPQLTYTNELMVQQSKIAHKPTQRQQPVRHIPKQQYQQQYRSQPKPKPKVDVISRPIYAPPSTFSNVPVRTSVQKRASSGEKKRAFAFNEYALLLMESGEYERAMNYFQKALDLDPPEETYKINMQRCREWLDYKKRGGRR
jgi:hypothetical protein